ncbi:DUF4135 domain-containing protein [Chitinophaga sp. 30R24]|uniref:DUF4135 domain-containing protein n=1 Tax=Chitinophaga sp. 30R24 TaxID=3248838 RepID=UPI003B8EB3B2
MNYVELEGILRNMGVTPPDIRRASLYLNYLQDARALFFDGLQPILGANNYNFVKTALRDKDLLNELADILDFYVGAAVQNSLIENENSNWTYAEYFNNTMLNDDYEENLDNFREANPVSTAALNHLYNHFTGNITRACERVYSDRGVLDTFYQALYTDTSLVASLDGIKSTGSDFHKGGQQVLILTMKILMVDTSLSTYQYRKMVYKPSDLEADCLLAGNSTAINAVVPHFMEASLFEIYNTALANYKMNNPAFKGLPVHTYGILPRNYQSVYHGDFPLPIREAYGYLEYLDNDLSGTTLQVNGYYPFGSSDYMIFNSQNETAIVQEYYRTAGALTALACTFSIQDLHVENMRVKKYLPYFIDMEISLHKAVQDVDATVLINVTLGNPSGGINGLMQDAQDSYWRLNSETARGDQVELRRVYKTVFYQNRLWKFVNTRNKINIPVNLQALQRGFNDGMIVLRAAQENNAFQPWFARLNNVVVRYIPYATAVFRTTFIVPYYLNPDNANGERTLEVMLRNKLTQEALSYAPPNNPNFLVLATAQCLEDLEQVDVPIFYYRIGMQQIVDSGGALVPIPQTVLINNNNPPPDTVDFDVNIGRATFFANVPTTTIVYEGQVQILSGDGYADRVEVLRASINEAMEDADITQTIPVNH